MRSRQRRGSDGWERPLRTGLAGLLVAAVTVVAHTPLALAAEAGLPPWWKVSGPTMGPAAAIGGSGAGCLAGAVALPLSGPGYEVMRPSRNRFHGHPRLVAFIEGFARTMLAQGWPGLLVGDLAQPRGGPMSSGHRSHQTGLDVDIWYRSVPAEGVTPEGRENMPAVAMVAAAGRGLNDDHWRDGHVLLLRTAAESPEVDRIFVHPAIKEALCEGVGPADRGWLRKVRPWWGHDHHFHVRLKCPAGEDWCENPPPLPAGDGCDHTLAWWFGDEAMTALEEQKRRPPARMLTLADLPPQCQAVLTAPDDDS